MACALHFLLIFQLIFLISMAASVSHNLILPKAAILPVTKDPSTLQYVAQISMSENLFPVNLAVDLNGYFLWVDNESKSVLQSHQPIKSCTLKCSMAKPIKGYYSLADGAECNSNTCTVQVENTVSRTSTSADLNEDKIGMVFWDGVRSDSLAKTEKFLFLSAPMLLLKGLSEGAKGMLGLGDSRISIPSQFSSTFGFFDRKFSLCLSHSKGAIFLGGTPLESQISSSMMFTPLISKKNGFQEGYYINVNSIKISGKKLSLNQKGVLGVKISTVIPYTTLESKIYGTFVESYVKAARSMNLTLVPPVSPFEACFSTKGEESQRLGLNVPTIDLVLQSEVVKWRISGRNSMVFVGDDVMCLGFLNGGLNPKDSIVVGGYQLEDYLLEFNLGNSMLGFSSLAMREKKCSDFEASPLSS